MCGWLGFGLGESVVICVSALFCVDGWKVGSSQCLMGYPRMVCAILHEY